MILDNFANTFLSFYHQNFIDNLLQFMNNISKSLLIYFGISYLLISFLPILIHYFYFLGQIIIANYAIKY